MIGPAQLFYGQCQNKNKKKQEAPNVRGQIKWAEEGERNTMFFLKPRQIQGAGEHNYRLVKDDI